MSEQAVDIAAIADLLAVSKDTAYRKAKLGEIPGFKVGTRWRFFPSLVTAHLTTPRDPWIRPARSRAARRRAA